jgi:multiple sugar transport system substrate-binding protein
VECLRQWFSLLYQYGGRLLNAADTHCLADSPAGIAAYAFLRDAIATHRVAMPEEGLVDADFLAGRVLMYVQGPWYIHGAHQAGLPFATAPMPRIGGRPAVWANSHVLAVVNTQDEDRVAAVMRFIAWLHAHALDWAEAGQIPASNSARARLAQTAIWPYLRPFVAALPYVVYQPNVLQHTALFAEQLTTPLTTATRAVMLGRQTPAEGVRALSDGVDQILAAPGAESSR